MIDESFFTRPSIHTLENNSGIIPIVIVIFQEYSHSTVACEVLSIECVGWEWGVWKAQEPMRVFYDPG
jgi:hypothetical protein